MTGSNPVGRMDRQLPIEEEIFLDHVGYFVCDPEEASRALARAGFAPTPVSLQVNSSPAGSAPLPTGTGNVTAMLSRGYIEVLFKTADTALGREFDAAMARYPGLHLAAFTVADAAKAHRRLAQAGFRLQPLVQMRRPVETEQGPDVAAFEIVRVEPGQMAEGRVQILTHRTARTVWQERWMTHSNGAVGLAALVIAVADVDEAAARFARFTGREAMSSKFGQCLRLDRGRVDLVTVDAFRTMFPDVPVPALPFMGAVGINVESLDTVEAVMRRGHLPTRRHGDFLVTSLPEALGQGVWLFDERRSAFG